MMDVNSNVNGLHSEPGFHPEARYEFKVHFDGADFEDLTYRVSFGAPDQEGRQPLQRRGYGQAVARELFPDVLPYVVGTPAVYSFTGFNGRTQADNAPEAMLSLVAGMAVPSGLRPSVAAAQRTSDFPYVVSA